MPSASAAPPPSAPRAREPASAPMRPGRRPATARRARPRRGPAQRRQSPWGRYPPACTATRPANPERDRRTSARSARRRWAGVGWRRMRGIAPPTVRRRRPAATGGAGMRRLRRPHAHRHLLLRRRPVDPRHGHRRRVRRVVRLPPARRARRRGRAPRAGPRGAARSSHRPGRSPCWPGSTWPATARTGARCGSASRWSSSSC